MTRRHVVVAGLVLLVACSSPSTDPVTSGPSEDPATRTTTPQDAPTTISTIPTTTAAPATTSTTAPETTTTTESLYARPDWLGTRLLPLRDDEFGEVQPTPPELVDRHLETLDLLPPPAGDEFEWTLGPVPEDVLARSTWTEECPVGLDELSYITVSHRGFDEEFHTGEMIVHADHAEGMVGVFRRLHEERFPIEQMRVITSEEVDAHPTGDWNDTTSFVCRPAVGSGSWSMHASGLAVDINPFHNPYLKGDLVLPELASYYTDRERGLDGMITDGDVVVQAFAEIGWPWGGNWNTLKDWMHFSVNGR